MLITTGSGGTQRSVTSGTTAQWEAAADLVPVNGCVLLNIETGAMKLSDGVLAVSALPEVEITAVTDIKTVTTVIYGTDITL